MTHRRRLQRRREVFDEASPTAQLDGSALQEERLLDDEVAVALAEAAGLSLGGGPRITGAHWGS